MKTSKTSLCHLLYDYQTSLKCTREEDQIYVRAKGEHSINLGEVLNPVDSSLAQCGRQLKFIFNIIRLFMLLLRPFDDRNEHLLANYIHHEHLNDGPGTFRDCAILASLCELDKNIHHVLGYEAAKRARPEL